MLTEIIPREGNYSFKILSLPLYLIYNTLSEFKKDSPGIQPLCSACLSWVCDYFSHWGYSDEQKKQSIFYSKKKRDNKHRKGTW